MKKSGKIISLLLAVLLLTAVFATVSASADTDSKKEYDTGIISVEIFDVSKLSDDMVNNTDDTAIAPESLRLPALSEAVDERGIVIRVESKDIDGVGAIREYRYPETEDRAIRLTYGSDGDTLGKNFIWEIKGNYDLVDGELTEREIVIKPHKDSDILASAGDVEPQKATADEATSDQADNSTTSPKTGDMTVLYIMIMIAAAAAVCVFSIKKIRE